MTRGAHSVDFTDVDAPFLLRAGYRLHLIRAIEEAARRLYLQGRLPGSSYDGRGQEATAVCAALSMGPDDVASPLIRDMAVHLVRGVTPTEFLCHYLGKAGGPMDGRDGNIHLGSFRHGTLSMISHLPEMLPVAMGVALARQRRGVSSVAVGFCGDGAAAGGVFHETLNLAACWRAPLVVVGERNGYAYMTPERVYLPVARISDRAAAYGIGSWAVDGNDVVEVHRTLVEAIEHSRAGRGPGIVEAFTYRMHGHGAHDDQRYVPPDELAEWSERDPLHRWRWRAAAELEWAEAEQQELDRRAGSEVDAALAAAIAAPYPPAEGLGPSLFA